MPVVITDEKPPISDIKLDAPYKHYVTFRYMKEGKEFVFTLAELEMMHSRALELMKEWRNDG